MHLAAESVSLILKQIINKHKTHIKITIIIIRAKIKIN